MGYRNGYIESRPGIKKIAKELFHSLTLTDTIILVGKSFHLKGAASRSLAHVAILGPQV